MVKNYQAIKYSRLSCIIAVLATFTVLFANAQNVGIGTTTPTTNLHVQGGASAGILVQNINGLGQSNVVIKSSTQPNTGIDLIHFNNNASGTFGGLALSGASIIRTGINNSGSLILGTTGNNPFYITTNAIRRLSILADGAMAIGDADPNASAQLDIQGTTGGLLLPRLTTTQRNAITSPANGLLVYNITTNNLNYFKTGTGWTEVGAGAEDTGNVWLTTGNFETPIGASLGTFNQEPLRFRVGGQPSGVLWYDAEANTFAGFASGVANQTGNQNNRANTGFGTSTLTGLSTGSRNTAVGSEAGFAMTTGTRNVYMGRQAAYMHNTQSGNVAIGSTALYHIKGNDHIAIGDSAYFGASTGLASSANIAIGKNALASATTASANIVLGRAAFSNIQTGTNNTIIGNNAFSNSSNLDGGQHNIALGSNTMNAAKGGVFNIAMSSLSLNVNEGDYNIALGPSALRDNASGNNNIALGRVSLRNNTTASHQIAVGDSALFNYTGTTGGNTAVGSKAGYNLTSGSENTAFGFEAMPNASFTNKNVAVGYQALIGLQGGGQNVAIGHSATLKNSVGGGATAIGAEASAGSFNSTAIGYQASVSGNNRMAFGNTDVISWIFGRTTNTANRALEVGTNNTNGNGAYLTTGGTWTNNSDINLKEDITNISAQDILQKIADLPISRWKYIGTDEYHIGPMAQDFYAAFQTGNDNKSISSIDPAGVSLAAIQALLEKVQQLEKEIEKLKSVR